MVPPMDDPSGRKHHHGSCGGIEHHQKTQPFQHARCLPVMAEEVVDPILSILRYFKDTGSANVVAKMTIKPGLRGTVPKNQTKPFLSSLASLAFCARVGWALVQNQHPTCTTRSSNEGQWNSQRDIRHDVKSMRLHD